MFADYEAVILKAEDIDKYCGLNYCWYKVKEFQEAMDLPHRDIPELMLEQRARERYDYMLEELNEFIESQTVVDQADAMIDLIYFAIGTLVEMGVKPQALFDIVQEANMSKLWPDGKPRFREEDLKVIKPAGWESPEPKIEAEINKQIEEGRE
ncbi:MAG: HAD family hydrolase [Firmicutes bacterium]|nr:HAD family hydrolase [Bacillota bacterium]